MAYLGKGNFRKGERKTTRKSYTATSGQTDFDINYDVGYIDVYLNGVKLQNTAEFTSTNGTSIVLASGAALNDIVDLVAYGNFIVSRGLTKTGDNGSAQLPLGTTAQRDGAPTAGYLRFNSTSAKTEVYDGSAWVNVDSTLDAADLVAKTASTGSAALPTGTTAQRDGTPTAGYMRYNSTTASFEGYGSAWGSIGGGATGGGTDDIFYENGQTVTANYTITTNKNAMSAGPITIDTGISVTVPTGSVWVIL
jgi:hypothetical protein